MDRSEHLVLRRSSKRGVLCALCFLGIFLHLSLELLVPATAAAASHDAPGLRWRTHRTERFLIHYPVSTGSVDDPLAVNGGRVALRIGTHAEQLFEGYQKLLEKSPALPVHIVVDAHLDQARAFAIPEGRRIELTSHPGPFQFFRSRGDWLRESIAHELAHLFLQAAGAALPPAVAAELEVNAPDRAVFSGLGTGALHPEVQVSAYVPFLDGAPLFWLEGGAEYLAGQLGANRWDAQRDMLLRMSHLEALLLGPEALKANLGRRGLDGERLYNQGYAFLLFFRERYGEEAFVRLLTTAAKRPRMNWLNVFEEGQGISFQLLSARFKEWLESRYPAPPAARKYTVGEELDMAIRPWRTDDQEQRRRWMAQPVELRRAQREEPSVLQAHPTWSPDQRFLAFWENGLVVRSIAEELWPTFGGRALNPTSDRLELGRRERRKASLPGLPEYPVAWAPDGKRLVVVADANWRPRGGGQQLPRDWTALFMINVTETGKDPVSLNPAAPGLPLPNTYRAVDPAWSPNGQWITFVRQVDGTSNLWLMKPDGSEARALTGFKDGTELAHPAWSPDSKRIVMEMFRQNQRDLWILDVENLSLEPVMLDPESQLQPHWAKDNTIYFSADNGGIYNIFNYDPSTLEVKQITDVPGGAFMPHVTPSGNLTYVAYDGYATRIYGLRAELQASLTADNTSFFVDPTLARSVLLGAHEAPTAEGLPYSPVRGNPPWQVIPTLSLNEYELAAGGRLRLYEPLGHHALELHLLAGDGLRGGLDYGLQRGSTHFGMGAQLARMGRPVAVLVDEGQGPETLNVRRQRRLGVLSTELMRGTDAFRLGLQGSLRRLDYQDRLDGLSWQPLHIAWSLGPLLQLSTFSQDGTHGLYGVDPQGGLSAQVRYQLRSASAWDPLTSGLVTDAGEVLRPGLHHRFEMRLRQALPTPWSARQTLDWSLNVGLISQNVSWWDELKAGGGPTGVETGLLAGMDGAVPFSGYSYNSLSGESLGVFSLAWRTPLVTQWRKSLGPMVLDSLYAQLGGTVGNVWGYREGSDGQAERELLLLEPSSRNQGSDGTARLLSELGVELRMGAALFNRYRWNGRLHVGYALQTVTGVGDVNQDNQFPGLYGELLPEAGGEQNPSGLRFELGLGAGF
ncbi:MAG: TolB family protein [Myxococcota bacterium]